MRKLLCLFLILGGYRHLLFGQQEPAGQPVVYKRAGGQELKLWIVTPQRQAERQRSAAVLLYHGGGFTHGTPADLERQAIYLAHRGLVAVLVEYRLEKAGTKDPIMPSVEDAISAIRWVRAHASELGIDPQRIAAAGGSAGGYLAAYLALFPAQKVAPPEDGTLAIVPNALILFNPVLDLGPGSCCFDRAGSGYKTRSPFFHVQSEMPPTLVMQGENDKLVSPEEARQFSAAIKAAGVRSELRMYPGQQHGFFNSGELFYQTLIEVDRFLASLGWLAGPPDLTFLRSLPEKNAPPT